MTTRLPVLSTLLAAAALAASAVQAAPVTVVTANPVVLPASGGGEEVQLRVTAPATGRNLPIIVFSHGARFTKDDYQPLVEYWAAGGFAVIQPDFLDADSRNIPLTDPRMAENWRARPLTVKRVLDQLDRIEAQTPGLKGRLDRSRIAAVGHSFGGHTTAAILGARIADPAKGGRADFSDKRVKVGLMIAPPGQGGPGGSELSPDWIKRSPYLDVSYAEMAIPALVIVGDKDTSIMTPRGAEWHEDPYRQGPGGNCLWTIAGAGHWMGGIGGLRHTETTDENPARVAAVQRVTLAYLKSALYPADPSWSAARKQLTEAPAPGDKFECK